MIVLTSSRQSVCSTFGVADPPNPSHRPRNSRRRTPAARPREPLGPRTAPRTYPTPVIRRRRSQVGAASPASTRGRCTRDPRHRPRNPCRRTPAARPREPLGPLQTRRRRRSQVGAASPASTRGRCTRDPRHRPRNPCRRTPTARPARTAPSTDGAADLPNPGPRTAPRTYPTPVHGRRRRPAQPRPSPAQPPPLAPREPARRAMDLSRSTGIRAGAR